MTTQGIASTNFQELNDLKLEARKDPKKALPAVAQQFEAIFLQSMLKSMRSSNHILEESNTFRGKNAETFQEMLDTQYISGIKGNQSMGFAQMLTKQLDPTNMTSKHRSMNQFAALAPVNPPATEAKAATEPTSLSTKDSSSSSAVDEFVQSLWSKAKEAASLMGLDPKILMAQAALETGWGKFIAKDSDGSSSNNLFNIKSGNNSEFESIKIKTTEYIADTPIKVSSNFRKYASVEESFNDYVSLIKDSERYKDAAAKAGNAELYIKELSKAGYATDPNYSGKILSIYNGDELNQAIKKYEALTEI